MSLEGSAVVPDLLRFKETPLPTVAAALAGDGLVLDLGAMTVRVRSAIAELAPALRTVYGEFPFLEPTGFTDVEVELVRSPGLRGMLRPSLRYLSDGMDPFGAQALDMPLPQLEWGMNWSFASLFNQYLLLHAGTLEIDGHGLLLIGEPGSGKSTLTAALALAGARALSDEFGVLRPADGKLLPIPKPVALKNRSIELIRSWSAEAVVGPTYHNTHKGDVAHLAMPRASAEARSVPATPRAIVFPTWTEDASTTLEPVGPAEAFGLVAGNSFNFPTTGEQGFDAVEALVRRCTCHRMRFSRLDDALDTLRELCR